MSSALWGIGLTSFAIGEPYGDDMNENLRLLTTLVQPIVLDKDLTAPPASPASGDKYIVDASATGAWASKDGQITVYDGAAWVFFEPVKGWRFYVDDESIDYRFDGAVWVALS